MDVIPDNIDRTSHIMHYARMMLFVGYVAKYEWATFNNVHGELIWVRSNQMAWTAEQILVDFFVPQ